MLYVVNGCAIETQTDAMYHVLPSSKVLFSWYNSCFFK